MLKYVVFCHRVSFRRVLDLAQFLDEVFISTSDVDLSSIIARFEFSLLSLGCLFNQLSGLVVGRARASPGDLLRLIARVSFEHRLVVDVQVVQVQRGRVL